MYSPPICWSRDARWGAGMGARVFDADAALDAALREATEGRGADLVIITAGGAAALPAAAARVRDGGTLHYFAGGAGDSLPLSLGALYHRELTAHRDLLVLAGRARGGLRAAGGGPDPGGRPHQPPPPARAPGRGGGADAAPRGGEGLRDPLAMRAQVFHGPGDLRFEDLPVPEPEPGGLVMRVEAALTCGTDVKTLRRGHPVMIPHVPTVFGHELAGVVTAVGRGATGVKEGDRVVAANSAPCGRCGLCAAGPAESLRGPALRQRRLRPVHRAAPTPGRPERGPDRARAGRVERGLRRAAGLRPAGARARPRRARHDRGDLGPRSAGHACWPWPPGSAERPA